MNWMLEIISTIFQTVYQFFDKILKSILESLPTFIELKQMLGNISLEGVFALCTGVSTILVTIASWGVKKALTKDNR